MGGGRHESTGCGWTTGICPGRQHGLSTGSLQRVIEQCWWEGLHKEDIKQSGNEGKKSTLKGCKGDN